jgi:YesN/AraC family two-component response regulator
VLLSDLHMPGAGDGLTVIGAMRHANPQAVTLLLSAFPEMGAATHAILLQADEILVKPMNLTALVDVIGQRVAAGPVPDRTVESVAQILEGNTCCCCRARRGAAEGGLCRCDAG